MLASFTPHLMSSLSATWNGIVTFYKRIFPAMANATWDGVVSFYKYILSAMANEKPNPETPKQKPERASPTLVNASVQPKPLSETSTFLLRSDTADSMVHLTLTEALQYEPPFEVIGSQRSSAARSHELDSHGQERDTSYAEPPSWFSENAYQYWCKHSKDDPIVKQLGGTSRASYAVVAYMK
jgi:hypothetical protein